MCHFKLFFHAALLSASMPTLAFAQSSIENKAQSIKDTLIIMCMAGGSETKISASGDLELRTKIKDIISGNIGASVSGQSQFNRQTWEGVIGGISSSMTDIQGQQASEARKCMVDNGFDLMAKILSAK